MATYKHLRSSTANKRPTTSITDGQLAINTNTASPGLFFKDSAGTGIVKVGPVHVGTTAPNATPAAGGSSGNYTGEQWLDTSVSPAQMKVWNGSAWVGIVADELPVSKLQDGAARQLLQTDAAGTGVEWTSNVDVPGTLDVTGATTLDSTLTVPLGSAAAPTVRFTGDTNTGIYSPGADQVAVATNGQGRLFVDASGKVEVSTATGSSSITPTELRISSTTDANDWNTTDPWARLGFYSADTTNGARTRAAIDVVQQFTNGNVSAFSFKTDNGSGTLVERQRITYTGTTTLTSAAATEPLIVKIDTSEVARIDSSGRVGIGTSTPQEKFVVSNGGAEGVEIACAVASNTNVIQNYNRSTSTYSRLRFDAADYVFRIGTSSKVTIDSAGNVGIGSTVPNEKLTVADSGSANVYIALQNSTTGTTSADGWYLGAAGTEFQIYGKENGPITFSLNSSEKARIDASGRLLVGTSSAIAIGGESSPKLQLIDASATSAGWFNLARFANSAGANAIQFGKSRGTTVGDYTIVQNNDALGSITFAGSDGTDLGSYGAQIKAEVDGTPGANDMPGRLVFSTTADGASSPTERMRINNRGHLLCGTTTDNTNQARVTVAPGPGSYNPDAGADFWKNCAVAGRGSFGGGLAVIQASGDGYTFYAVGTPSTLRVRYGADGGTATSNGVNLTSTATSWSANSDERLKTDLIPIEAGLEKASSLRAVTGRYLTDEEGVSRAFLIAQDVQAVLPEAVDQEGDEIGTLSLRYTEVIPLLVAALKESKERIETLEAKVAALESA
jgi:hypothetical protein